MRHRLLIGMLIDGTSDHPFQRGAASQNCLTAEVARSSGHTEERELLGAQLNGLEQHTRKRRRPPTEPASNLDVPGRVDSTRRKREGGVPLATGGFLN